MRCSLALLAWLIPASAFADEPGGEGAVFPAGAAPAANPYAAPAEARGTVTQVVVQGNRRIEPDTVLASMTLRRGDTLTPDRVRRDLKSVFATGFFDDVRFEIEPDGTGVALVVIVKEKPAIRAVKLAGNRKINEDDIRKAIDIHEFAVLSDAEVRQNADRIRDLYIEKGYYLAEVKPDIAVLSDDQVELTFRITENKKVTVQRIDFSGNQHVPAAKIKRYLQTKEGGALAFMSSRGAFKKENLENDGYIVAQVFREEGYADVQVDAPKVFLTPDKRFVNVSFHVTEGPRYSLGEVLVDGDFVPEEGLSEENLLRLAHGTAVYDLQDELWRKATGRKRSFLVPKQKSLDLAAGRTFKLSEVLAINSAIEDFYTDQGYAFVNVIPNPITHPEAKTVDIAYQIEKGVRVRVGKIEISGNDPTFDKVVRREITINEGDVYRGSAVKASRARIERLGFFEKVDISTPRGDGDNVLDLNVGVTERPTGTFSAGLGLSTQEKFVLTFNVSKNNFLGLGYNMSAAVNWSALRRQFQFSFADPYFLDSRWTFQASAYSQNQQFVNTLEEYQRGGSIGLGRYLDNRNDVNLQVAYTLEDVGLQSLDAYRRRLLGGQLFRNGLTSRVGLTITADKRNDRIFATKGFLVQASVDLAGGFAISKDKTLSLFGGAFNFVEMKANLRAYKPLLGDDKFVLRLNSSIGKIVSTDGRVVPYIHLYRAGGIQSLRGYNWFSLGPTIRAPGSEDPVSSDTDMILGGTETWTNNLEIETPIVKSAGISGVVFFDAGNAFGDPFGNGRMNLAKFRYSVGAGVRWRSPMGPLRFELGIPLNPEPGWRKQVFDFGIGSFF